MDHAGVNRPAAEEADAIEYDANRSGATPPLATPLRSEWLVHGLVNPGRSWEIGRVVPSSNLGVSHYDYT